MPEAHGHRLVCIGHYEIGFVQIAKMVKDAVGKLGYRIATTEAPTFVLGLASLFDSSVGVIRAELKSKAPILANDKIKRILKMDFIPIDQTIADHAHALIQLGVDKIKMRSKYRKALEAGDIPEYKH